MQLSFDDAFSFFVAKGGLENIFPAVLYDNHPPFYFLFLHLWIKIFGTSVYALITPSVIFGVGTIIILYFFLREIFDSKSAIKGTILFSLMPFLKYFSTQVRMYTLFLFLSLLASFFFIKLSRRIKKKHVFFFVLFLFLALQTHYYAYLLIIPFLVIALMAKEAKKLIFIILVPFFLSLPWLFLYLITNHPGSFIQSSLIATPLVFTGFIIDPVTLRTIIRMPGHPEMKIIFLSAFSLVIVTFLKGLRNQENKKRLVPYWLLFFIPIIVLFTINLLLPVFSARPTIFLAPFFFVFFMQGLKSFGEKTSNAIFLLTGALLVVLNVLTSTNSELRGLDIKESMKAVSSEKTIFHTSVLTYYPFRYYGPEKENHLTTKNPLASQTIEIIGGKKEDIPENLTRLVLVDTKNGADKKEVDTILKNLFFRYQIEKITKIGDITIFVFTHPPLTTKIRFSPGQN